MKILLISILLGVGVSVAANSVNAAPAESAAPAAPTAKKKSTEVSFDDLLIQGKHHFSDEQVITVEDDKVLDALLGVRKDFKDRIQKSSVRR